MELRQITITCLLNDVLQEPKGNSNYYTLRCFTSTNRSEQPQRKPLNLEIRIRTEDTALVERVSQYGKYDTIVVTANYFDIYPYTRNDGTPAAILQLYPTGRSSIRLARRHPNNRLNASEEEVVIEDLPSDMEEVATPKKAVKAVASGVKVSRQGRMMVSEPADPQPEEAEGDPFADMDSDPFA